MSVLNSALMELAVRGSFFREVECLIGSLLSKPGEAGLICRSTGIKVPLDILLPWFCFCARDGHSFAVCLPERRKCVSAAGYFLQALSFNFPAESSGAAISFSIRGEMPAPLPESAQVLYLVHHDGQKEKVLFAQNFERCLSMGCSEKESKMQEGEKKETADRPVPVELYLGELLMKVEDLLSLRPGSSVQFPCPQGFTALLKTGSRLWARVVMRILQERIVLEIQEIEEETPPF